MISSIPLEVVITGIGMVTPLGKAPREVLSKIERGELAWGPPTSFDPSPFLCRVCAEVEDFRAEQYVSEPKMLRLMSQDSKLAVAAAHLALQDARVLPGVDYPSDQVALYGATGAARMRLDDVAELIKVSSSAEGQLDLQRFGHQGLRSVNPLLSFKVLSNMPVCFVSICEHVHGSNAIYTPWEGHGAQAIEAGMHAIQRGQARCALVGGCEVKTHELAFLSLQQEDVFRSWKEQGIGTVPGDGAVFLVLEEALQAQARSAQVYARLVSVGFSSRRRSVERAQTYSAALRKALAETLAPIGMIVSAADGDPAVQRDEEMAMAPLPAAADGMVSPKKHVGNLFAAAAALQVGLGAVLVQKTARRVLVNCFGHGSEQAAFVLDKP